MTKTTKILFIGDPHFQVNNIPEVDIFIDKITMLAKNCNPEIIIIAGDLLHNHERLHTIPLNRCYKLVNLLRNICLTYILVGNHDMINHHQFLNNKHWMNGMKEWKNTVIVDQVKFLKIRNLKFIFAPFVAPGRFEEALNTLNEDWKTVNCIFAHQEFYGCKMGAITSTDGDKWDLNYPQVISGHIHSRQKPQANIYYPGSAMQNAFGESKKNIIPILTWDENGDHCIEEIDLKLPRKKIIYSEIDDIEKINIENTRDKIKISVTGIYEQFKAFKKSKKYKELHKKGIKIVFKPKKIEKHENKSQEIKEKSFCDILKKIIHSKKNTYLNQIYQLVLYNKNVELNSILYI